MEMLVVFVLILVVAGFLGAVTLRRRGSLQIEQPSVVPSTAEATPDTAAPVLRASLKERLGKTRLSLATYLRNISGRGIDESVYEELEEMLLLSDVGLPTTTKLLGAVRGKIAATQGATGEDAVAMLRAEIEDLLLVGVDRSLKTRDGAMSVWLFVGVNGVGKTTTIGKLAARHTTDGQTVMLAAADTFRAAASEQLTKWAHKTGAEIVKADEGADPSAVVFDAMASAASKGIDLLLVDTAGRLHTKHNLMSELEKLRRIIDRNPGALQEVLLVIDATTGQNGLEQAKQFAETAEVTGIILTKLDGTAKGGIVLAIQAELGLAVKAVGIGETVTDLIDFEPHEFVSAIFDSED